jgi:hypothetical protein
MLCDVEILRSVPIQHFLSLSVVFSVADRGCLSRILIFTHPGSWNPDLGSKNSNKRKGLKKIRCHTFFGSHKFHKIENYFIFGMLKKKFGPVFKEI